MMYPPFHRFTFSTVPLYHQSPTANGQKPTNMRNFRTFNIWSGAIQVSKTVYRITREFPTHEKYGLCSQMQRAAVSIASNIAEGASRKSEVEFSRYLEISMGSSFELETQLIISNKLGYINETDFNSFLIELNTLQKQINQFITKLKG